jgi:hypothetical protein
MLNFRRSRIGNIRFKEIVEVYDSIEQNFGSGLCLFKLHPRFLFLCASNMVPRITLSLGSNISFGKIMPWPTIA